MTIEVVDPWAVYPLDGRDVSGVFRTWQEWLAAWRDATSQEELLSLLYSGLGKGVVSCQEDAERLCFYLRLADGYNDTASWMSIRIKSWRTVATTSFTVQDLDPDNSVAHRYLFQPESLGCILKFFLRGHNLPFEHDSQIENRRGREFIERYVRACWRSERGRYLILEDWARREKFLRLLIKLKKLEVLLEDPLFLGREDVRFLVREGRDNNRVRTLEECFASHGTASYTAGVVIQLLAKVRGLRIQEVKQEMSGSEREAEIARLREGATSFTI